MKTNYAANSAITDRNILRWICAVIACAVLLGQPVLAADQYPPGKMTFQGFLVDTSNNTPIGNDPPENRTLQFRIYNSPTATAAANILWAEEQVVTVDKGHFSVLLGEGGAVNGLTDKHSANLAPLFLGADASDRFIGITISGQSEIAPRIQFFAAPYAQNARAAQTLISANGSASTTLDNVALLNMAQTFTATKNFGAGAGVSGANVIEFGQGVAGKDVNAGKIGYGAFTPGTLDIVGVGNSATRSIRLWAEGGLQLMGPPRSMNLNANTRGDRAVDLQFNRTEADQVAGGADSVLIGGSNNKVSTAASYSAIAGGGANTVTGSYSFVGGGGGNSVSGSHSLVGGSGHSVSAGSALVVGVANDVRGAYGVAIGHRNFIGPDAHHSFVGGYRSRATMYSQFVWSDGNTDDDFIPQTQNSFNVRCRGNAYFVGGTVNGALNNTSDRNVKTNFQSIVPREILAKLVQLPISKWSYTNMPTVVHVGAVSQDFSRIFEIGSDDKTIGTMDADGVAMASIQGLHEIVLEQKTEIEQLKRSVAELQRVVELLSGPNRAAGE